MLRFAQIIALLFFTNFYAQNKTKLSIYFDFDKHYLLNDQQRIINDFLISKDTSLIEAVQIYGYCDDRGEDDYNILLSKKRVATVEKLLKDNGISKRKIVILEGRGEIALENIKAENVNIIRSKNRRVDILFIERGNLGKGIYTSFQDYHKEGDVIVLDKILFDIGSSKISWASRKELDKIVVILKENPNIEFEIRGHVCCTPRYYKDAVDRETNQRKLSYNRAKNVYRYLISRNISSSRMTFKGLGNRAPLGKGAAFDRRVEFLITKF